MQIKNYLLLLLISISSPLFSQKINTTKGIALEGYDAVSYFSNKPVKGMKQYSISFQGAVYLFSSKENAEKFRLNALSYVPQYGGWCAYAMGNTGEYVEVDPETFKIINGQLFLFYNKYFTNTLKSWNKDEKNLKAKADLHWKKLSQK